MCKAFDMILFMGQSNMAGRGIVSDRFKEPAPSLAKGAGYEYRAVTAPDKLSELCEPFGVNENRAGGINEPGMKTGSMVCAFVNAYYKTADRPVIAVSASKGGSAIAEWQGKNDYLSDALKRYESALAYCAQNGIEVGHRYVIWCQGETDGDIGTSREQYYAYFSNMQAQLAEKGIEHIFLIAIGQYNGSEGQNYEPIHKAQLEMEKENPFVTLVSDSFYGMRAKGLMKDAFHYYQEAYNFVGNESGTKTGLWTIENKRD